MAADHYAALGVPPHASSQEVRAAYRRVMRECHPDVRPGDAAAEERARRANQAWQVLKDGERRAAYDRQLAARRPRPAARAVPTSGQWGYQARRKDFARDFHRACLRVGAAVFAGGLLVLALTTG